MLHRETCRLEGLQICLESVFSWKWCHGSCPGKRDSPKGNSGVCSRGSGPRTSRVIRASTALSVPARPPEEPEINLYHFALISSPTAAQKSTGDGLEFSMCLSLRGHHWNQRAQLSHPVANIQFTGSWREDSRSYTSLPQPLASCPINHPFSLLFLSPVFCTGALLSEYKHTHVSISANTKPISLWFVPCFPHLYLFKNP